MYTNDIIRMGKDAIYSRRMGVWVTTNSLGNQTILLNNSNVYFVVISNSSQAGNQVMDP